MLANAIHLLLLGTIGLLVVTFFLKDFFMWSSFGSQIKHGSPTSCLVLFFMCAVPYLAEPTGSSVFTRLVAVLAPSVPAIDVLSQQLC